MRRLAITALAPIALASLLVLRADARGALAAERVPSVVAGGVAAPASASAPRRPAAARGRLTDAARAAMIAIPAGRYLPLYGRPGDAAVRVAGFRLDRDAVTRGDFLAFVREHPEWRRDSVRPLRADRAGYLAGWRAPLDVGAPAELRRPVTRVSWFAARAYCAARGKRLPTVDEWEYAAAASESRRDASRDPAFVQRLVALYATRGTRAGTVDEGERNAYGVRGLHGLVWEWTADFNSVLVSDDSREVGGRDHDMFCASAAIGATDPTNYAAFLRYAMRAGLAGRSTLESLGFRCAA
jgi:formylglycine-generating enzyme required for sulfatase activity